MIALVSFGIWVIRFVVLGSIMVLKPTTLLGLVRLAIALELFGSVLDALTRAYALAHYKPRENT